MLPSDVRAFFDGVADGDVGLTVDTGHLARSGVRDLPGFVREFGPLVDNVHLKDVRDGAWRLLGDGDLDLVAVLAALEEIGFDGWLCVDEESDADLETGMRVSREWLDGHPVR